jgi:hypothetical protein
MSDQSQGPGWWLASDGKWYPPETHPDYVAAAPAPAPEAWVGASLPAYDQTTQEAPPSVADATTPTAHGQRNWRRIALIVAGVLIALAIIGAIAGDPDDPDDDTEIAASGAVTTTTHPPPPTRATTATTQPSSTVATTVASTAATGPPTTQAPRATAPPTTKAPAETVSQQNARRKAAQYLKVSAFSRRGLIEQLEYEGFSESDATYGVDALNVDWNDQAAKKAAQYLEISAFSHDGLVEQLMYEGFTRAQAEYGVSTTGL